MNAPVKLALFMICWFPALLPGQGAVMLVGGGGEDYNDWSDAPYRWFVQQADSGKIINIDVDEASAWYPGYFRWLGAAQSSHALQIATVSAANDPAIYQELISAKGIFIEGGDQWEYLSAWKGTLVEEAIEQVFFGGGAIGGTSAGMAILGEVIFDARYGSANPEVIAYNPYHSRVQFTDDFLNILPGVFTDSHFHPRGRLGRLVPMLARSIQDYGDINLIGVGVDENTALCIDAAKNAAALGEGTVTILYRGEQSRISLAPNQAPTFTGIHYHQLNHGAVFNLESRTLIDPGLYLQPVGNPPPAGVYADTTLNGSLESAAAIGEIVITNLTGHYLNAWRGLLGQAPGIMAIPQSVIIPRLWNDPDFFENRWIGGMYGVAGYPHFSAIYLDDNSNSSVSAEGILAADKLAYVLDTYTITHAGFIQFRNTNYPGIIDARLHFLGDGDSYDLKNHGPLVSLFPTEDLPLPATLQLYGNYPNPFNPATCITYEISRPARVRLEILNALGQTIVILLDEVQTAGRRSVEWRPGPGTASGIYFYRLNAESVSVARKCLLLK